MPQATRMFNGKRFRLMYSTKTDTERRKSQKEAREYARRGFSVRTVRDAAGLDHIYVRKR